MYRALSASRPTVPVGVTDSGLQPASAPNAVIDAAANPADFRKPRRERSGFGEVCPFAMRRNPLALFRSGAHISTSRLLHLALFLAPALTSCHVKDHGCCQHNTTNNILRRD